MKNDLMELAKALSVDEKKTDLSRCNELGARFGLELTQQQAGELALRRQKALHDTGRVEFGGGVIEKLVHEFCDSPYISNDNYAETLATLQDCFYFLKNEAEDEASDDELIERMGRLFNGRAAGSLDYLEGTSFSELLRLTSKDADDEEDFDAD